MPGPDIPHHDRPSSVVAFGDNAFKIEVRYGMILNLHGQTLVAGIEGWAFGHGPRLEHAIHLEAEVVVQASSTMLLYHEAVAGLLLHLGRRFGSFFKAAFTFVLF